MQQQQRQAQAQALIDEAAQEAQRQREMFVKLPTKSFQDLAKARSESVGGLTQLLNPNPELFPVNHPYRRNFSSGEIRRGGISAMSPMQPLTPTIPSQPPPPAPVPTPHVPAAPGAGSAVPVPASIRPSAHRRKSSDTASIRSAFSPPRRSAGLALSKSAAALPVATQIQVGSTTITHNAAAPTVYHAAAIPNHVHHNSGGSGAYRPRGPPMGQEMDPESDSDGGGIMISHSVAQEKLRALVQRTSAARNPEPNAAGPSGAQHPPPPVADDNDVPQWAMVSPQPPQNPPPAAPARRVPAGLQLTRMEPEQRPPATAPIQVGYPYNLPLPLPPSTPRTTRRNMLSTEMSESLRRNLLWQRQTSKPNPAAIRRTTSAGASRLNPLGGEQAVLPSMVQLHPKGTKPEGTSQIAHEPAPATQQERDEARQRRISRNKSYADDYHYTGW